MVYRNFILSEICKPCLLFRLFDFAQLILPYQVKLQKKGEKFTTYDRFHVQSIEYNDQREISALVIANSFGKVVYSWVASKATVPSLSDAQMKGLQAELERTGIALETVLQRYKVNSLGELQADMYQRAMSSLKRTKTKAGTAA